MTTGAYVANVLKNLIESKKFINDCTNSYYPIVIIQKKAGIKMNEVIPTFSIKLVKMQTMKFNIYCKIG